MMGAAERPHGRPQEPLLGAPAGDNGARAGGRRPRPNKRRRSPPLLMECRISAPDGAAAAAATRARARLWLAHARPTSRVARSLTSSSFSSLFTSRRARAPSAEPGSAPFTGGHNKLAQPHWPTPSFCFPSLSLSLSFCLRLFVCRPDDWPAACLRAPNGQARRPRAAVSRSQSASQSAKQRGGRAFRRRAPRHDRARILSAAEPEERAQRGPEWGQEWGATRSRGGRKRTNKVAGGRANPIGGRRASRIELESVYLLQH